MTKTATAPANLLKASEDKIQQVHLGQIRSNLANPRKSAPNLHALGYPIFNKDEIKDTLKPTLISMALSDNGEVRAEFCRLIEKFESRDPDQPAPEEGDKNVPKGGIIALALSIQTGGLLQPVAMRHNAEKDGYDLVFGARRCLAVAYNHARMEGSLGAKPSIRAKIVDVNDAVAEMNAVDENLLRLAMNPIDQANNFQRMRNVGLDIKEISEKTNVDHQTVRSRLQLLKLKPEEQEKIKKGELPVTKGLAIVKSRQKGQAEPTVITNKNQTGRSHAPTVNQWREIYETGMHDGKDISGMGAREFAAKFILSVPFETVEKIKKRQEAESKS